MVYIFCLEMERFLTLVSLILIFIAYGESYPMGEEELQKCYSKLICEKDKIKEFYDIATLAGPENHQAYVDFVSKVFNVEDPVSTLEYWILFKETFCERQDKLKNRGFNDWMSLVCEHMLDEIEGIFAKYKSMGICDDISDVPKGMMPGGTGQMASPFG